MGYARALLDAQRYPEALQQLQQVTREKPEFPKPGWCRARCWCRTTSCRGRSGAQALRRAGAAAGGERRAQPRPGAGLPVAVADRREAQGLRRRPTPGWTASRTRRTWCRRRTGAPPSWRARASMDEARKLIRAARAHARRRAHEVMAEVQLLRDNKQYKRPTTCWRRPWPRSPGRHRPAVRPGHAGREAGRLRRDGKLLRQLMVKPDYHHAYNALGFSLAERNVRLPEAAQLIQKGAGIRARRSLHQRQPGLGRVPHGQPPRRCASCRPPTRSGPTEIAAHLGEVLWSMGQRDQAQSSSGAKACC
jgi:hypothetical protein